MIARKWYWRNVARHTFWDGLTLIVGVALRGHPFFWEAFKHQKQSKPFSICHLTFFICYLPKEAVLIDNGKRQGWL
jgi:hypothetical protein